MKTIQPKSRQKDLFVIVTLMRYLLIRHGETDANRLTRLAFGKEGAPLNDIGRKNADKLSNTLKAHGIDVKNEPASSSELQRARQTAEIAGFSNINTNALLNEINTNNPQLALELVAKHQVPEEAILAARAILNNLPDEKIWFTHGLVIAALQVVLNIHTEQDFTPDYCEVRVFDL